MVKYLINNQQTFVVEADSEDEALDKYLQDPQGKTDDVSFEDQDIMIWEESVR